MNTLSKTSNFDLRYYQREARYAVLEEWEKGNTKTIIVLPTGTGKTIVFAAIAEECVRRGKRVLILAHRWELLDQAADKIKRSTGLGCSIEKAGSYSIDEFFMITVASVQTMMRDKRLEQFPPNYFDVIVVDEAHHVLAESYQRILNYFSEAYVLGVTATPDRGDMRDLGSYFQSLAYEYTLPRAIKDGFLCRIKAQTIPLKLDLSGVAMQNGDFSTRDLGTALDPYLEQIATEMQTYCQGRKSVVFLPLIATSKRFTELLLKRGFRAAEVNGESQDRTEVLRGWDSGHFDVLCNSMLLTEGWDSPHADCIVCLRPTKIRSLYAQIIGRGTRMFPGKDHLLILDFLWQTERLDLCRPAYLIADSADVAKCATDAINAADGPVDLEDAIGMGEGAAIEEREKALAKKLAEMKHRKRQLVDPLQYECSILDKDLAKYVPVFGKETEPPTAAQKKALEKAGLFPDEIESRGKAEALLEKVRERQAANLATPKQIRQLESRGFVHVGTWDFDAARKMINWIASNGWRTPHSINPNTYVPKRKAS